MTARIGVGFDFDHTLGIDNKLERTVALASLASYAGARGVTYDEAEAGAAIDAALASFRSGAVPIEIAIASFLERFVHDGGAATMDVANDFRNAVLAAAPAHIEAIAGANAMLDELARLGIPVAILTNGWSPLQEEKARLISFSGPVLVSERVGVRKPEAQAFALLSNALSRAPEAVWYVGDDPAADCAAANACGMTSVWFDWENNAYPADLSPASHRIASLAELPALLQGRA